MIAMESGPASRIIEVSSGLRAPVSYEQRDDVEIVIKREEMPAEWRSTLAPSDALEPLIEPRFDPPPSFTKSVQIRKGGTLGKALSRAGTQGDESHEAIVALRKVFNLRRLRPGQEVNVRFTAAPDAKKLTTLDALTINVDVDRIVIAERDAAGKFKARIVKKDLRREYGRIAGTSRAACLWPRKTQDCRSP